ncbi:MAG: hypothetical protein JSW27_23690 [Phycisphaerales bacterium]|nr:MAG: hypothetical protein JSW27_23690 [Phycisphaerales bacterium]
MKVLSLTVAGTWPDHFTPGERVVLLQDAPPGGLDLMTGQAGTVVCGDPKDGSGDLLISWDFWANGKADLTRCAEAKSLLYPSNSVIWVDPRQVLIGRHFNACGTIRKGLEGCVYLETDDGQEYNLVAAGQLYLALAQGGALAFGDRVQVWGLFNNTPPGPAGIRLCPQGDGDIYHPIVSPCPKSDPDPGPKPGPDEIVIGIGGNALVLDKVSGNTYVGCTTLSLELNFQALLSVEITPGPGIGGTWSGTLDPAIVGPGEATTQICVTVEDLDTGLLPPGNDVQVATVSLFAVPAP